MKLRTGILEEKGASIGELYAEYDEVVDGQRRAKGLIEQNPQTRA